VRLLQYFSPGSLVVMAITFVLFAFALTVRGVTHDLLLETAVFLVSIKLMLMTYRNTRAAKALDEKLDRIYEAVTRQDGPAPPPDGDADQSTHE